jgi:hypothetical protein
MAGKNSLLTLRSQMIRTLIYICIGEKRPGINNPKNSLNAGIL